MPALNDELTLSVRLLRPEYRRVSEAGAACYGIGASEWARRALTRAVKTRYVPTASADVVGTGGDAEDVPTGEVREVGTASRVLHIPNGKALAAELQPGCTPRDAILWCLDQLPEQTPVPLQAAAETLPATPTRKVRNRSTWEKF